MICQKITNKSDFRCMFMLLLTYFRLSSSSVRCVGIFEKLKQISAIDAHFASSRDNGANEKFRHAAALLFHNSRRFMLSSTYK